MSSKYALTYNVELNKDGITKEEVREKGLGACDEIVVISILRLDCGCYSQALVSLDGCTGEELSADKVWEAWAVMAAQLADDLDLNEAKRDLCRGVSGPVQAALGVFNKVMALSEAQKEKL